MAGRPGYSPSQDTEGKRPETVYIGPAEAKNDRVNDRGEEGHRVGGPMTLVGARRNFPASLDLSADLVCGNR